MDTAVCRVMPAVNLDPDDRFRLGAASLARTRRDRTPRAQALNNVQTLFVFMGMREAEPREADARRLAADAVASPGAPVRAACTRLIVGWERPDGTAPPAAYAAAFEVAADHSVGP
jgi:hypothetical protein